MTTTASVQGPTHTRSARSAGASDATPRGGIRSAHTRGALRPCAPHCERRRVRTVHLSLRAGSHQAQPAGQAARDHPARADGVAPDAAGDRGAPKGERLLRPQARAAHAAAAGGGATLCSAGACPHFAACSCAATSFEVVSSACYDMCAAALYVCASWRLRPAHTRRPPMPHCVVQPSSQVACFADSEGRLAMRDKYTCAQEQPAC